jgi:hypothetical protein
MTISNYWEQFMESGKINDYLSYASHEKRSATPKWITGSLGADTYAGIRMCDRHRTENSTYRGI